MSEISVLYSEHQCPSHDLAGWRKERVPERPSGIMTLAPDWVCEILSPGHERKDMVHHLLLLQRAAVPYYWILSPEDRTLIVYALDGSTYRLCYSVAYRPAGDPGLGAYPALRVDRHRPQLHLRRDAVIGRAVPSAGRGLPPRTGCLAPAGAR